MKRSIRAIFNALLIILFLILAFGFYSVAFAQFVELDVNQTFTFSCVLNDQDSAIFIFNNNQELGDAIEGRCTPGSGFEEQPSSTDFGYRLPGTNGLNKFVFTNPGTYYVVEYSPSGLDINQLVTVIVNTANTGFSNFLGSTTPLSIINDVTGGVQSATASISPVVALAGVPLAFTIGGYLLWFIRRSTA